MGKKGKKGISLGDLNPNVFKYNPQLIQEWGGTLSKCPATPLLPEKGVEIAENASRGGKKRLQMTGPEQEYSLILERDRQAGKIAAWQYEAITLRWGEVAVVKYTPDFVIFDLIEGDGGTPRIQVRLIEIKGPHIHNRQAAVRTWKEARNYWHKTFAFEFWQKTSENGWQRLFT